MQAYTYTVWIRNSSLSTEDERHETSTSFNVLASNAGSAQQWGDRLTKQMTARNKTLQSIRSRVEPVKQEARSLPTIVYGHNASDEEIGW